MTDLATDLRMKDSDLNASYLKQWELFEKRHWWPWYERWGPLFFGSAVAAAISTPPKVVEQVKGVSEVGRV